MASESCFKLSGEELDNFQSGLAPFLKIFSKILLPLQKFTLVWVLLFVVGVFLFVFVCFFVCLFLFLGFLFALFCFPCGWSDSF